MTKHHFFKIFFSLCVCVCRERSHCETQSTCSEPSYEILPSAPSRNEYLTPFPYFAINQQIQNVRSIHRPLPPPSRTLSTTFYLSRRRSLPTPHTICHSHSLSIFSLFVPLRLFSSLASAAFALSTTLPFLFSLWKRLSRTSPSPPLRTNCVGEIRLSVHRWRCVQGCLRSLGCLCEVEGVSHYGTRAGPERPAWFASWGGREGYSDVHGD
ncbi:hypothetical protein TNCT_325711 [Trichonephila clavata]|uniref:Uncharacterized protein n=1 Tax=Trichonephila clavata TaxID=2740835 RepID=A0A8X6LF11_TRICU|nr:hypothetical protein TNCT_325711 [Trichonephila clavata]